MPFLENELASILRRDIAAAGPISFARFMEAALYHPTHGYYQQPWKQIGCQGDFYTSVSVGPLFGRLLGFRFSAWLDALASSGSSAALQLVEGGAHDGRLAVDILSWFQERRPDLLGRLEYWILEPSAARCESQARLLAPFGGKVRWRREWEDAPIGTVHGVIFANELLDALPVFRLGWDRSRQQWFEWKVGTAAAGFVWVPSTEGLAREIELELHEMRLDSLPPELAEVLPDGFSIEVCPPARTWWSKAAARLGAGKLLTFDYGLEWPEMLAPHRAHGTLRGYSRHVATDPLSNPGTQDLTAHVNFSEMVRAGESAGLTTDRLCSQSLYLTEIARDALADLARFGSWGERETRQFQTLTHPDHLGRSFRVLVQSRPDRLGLKAD